MSVFSNTVTGHLAASHFGGKAAAQQGEIVAKQHDRFLNRAHPPARLSATDAAEILGFHEDDMSILVRERPPASWRSTWPESVFADDFCPHILRDTLDTGQAG